MIILPGDSEVKNLSAMQETWVPSLGREDLLEKEMVTHSRIPWASLVVQMVKNPPAVWETWVRSLGWEDSPEKGMATHSSILAWRIPKDIGALWAIVHGVSKSWT